ncbi:Spore coat protein SA [Planctomycetes bacterium Pan216]|uniref:Spore coat protein SA n=1 Tax=Kolteria novifilia TaxID=2527975 RepID=A0A518BBH7_9BACT|nr:Spore coat protein SA [Planctomycetes bacterium Pan216]
MSQSRETIAYLTAGAANMFCGSCLRDNALAGAIQRLGRDIVLIPTYTPLRTDEDNNSQEQVYFGGINVYLQEKIPFFRYLPQAFDRWLDRPGLIRWLASFGIRTNPEKLGKLTVSMLRGEQGNLRKEVDRLAHFLQETIRPSLINLSNILIGGCIPELKRRLGCPVLVTLQGDDLFLEGLPEPYFSQALEAIARLGDHIDGYIVFSNYYADYMATLLGVPRERFHIASMGINLIDFHHEHQPSADGATTEPPAIGYLARICPAKGFHLLVDAFLELRKRPGMEQLVLRAAGWLGKDDEKFFEEQLEKIRRAGAEGNFVHHGSVDRQGKVEFLKRIDVLSVPTTYREPKGIYVLEALASGVPVITPDHGAFPELLSATGGGRLHRPNDTEHLAEMLEEMLTDHPGRDELARLGKESVHRSFSAEMMAADTLAIYDLYLKRPSDQETREKLESGVASSVVTANEAT